MLSLCLLAFIFFPNPLTLITYHLEMYLVGTTFSVEHFLQAMRKKPCATCGKQVLIYPKTFYTLKS